MKTPTIDELRNTCSFFVNGRCYCSLAREKNIIERCDNCPYRVAFHKKLDK